MLITMLMAVVDNQLWKAHDLLISWEQNTDTSSSIRLANPFYLAKSTDPYEMPHHSSFHLGLQCLSKYPFSGFNDTKG